jgi:selenocysteine-specific elongation factor
MESDRGVDLARFEATYGITRDHAAKLYDDAGLVLTGKDARTAFTRSRFDALRAEITAHLEAFHRAQPQATGEELETIRKAVAVDLAVDAFAAILRTLVDERKIEASGSSARLVGHNATANSADDKLWHTLRPALEAAGFNAPPVRELALQLKLKEPVVKDFLHRKAKTGEVLKVTPDRFYPRPTVATLAAIAQATAQAQANGTFTAAQYRDAVGVGRGLAIEILEFLDTLAITQRIGDARKMRKDFAPILGAATAPPPRSKAASKPAPQPTQRRVQTYRR